MSVPVTNARQANQLHLGLSLLLAVLIGAVFLYLATRAVPVDEIIRYLEVAEWGRIGLASLVFLPVYALCHAARITRWYFLIRPLTGGDVRSGTVHRVCTVGSMAILLLPLRLGEFVRPFLLAKSSRVPAVGALATVVVERVIDGLVITGLLFVGLWTYQGDRSVEFARAGGTVAAAIFVPALIMVIVAYKNRKLARSIVMSTVGHLSVSLGEKVAGLLEQFALGFQAVSRGRDLFLFLGGTALYWVANVLSMWLLLRLGFGLEVGPWEMVTVMAVLVVGIMVPAGPAMAGNFEYFVAQGMGLFVPLGDAGGPVAVFAALLHLLQIVVIVLPGVWIMVRYRDLRLSRQKIAESKSMAEVGAAAHGTGHHRSPPIAEGPELTGPDGRE